MASIKILSLKATSSKKRARSQKVKARTLDGVLRKLGINKVDLIKIDVKGAEYEVIRGLENTLRQQNPKLFIEILRSDQEKILQYLNDHGYQGEKLYYLLHSKRA